MSVLSNDDILALIPDALFNFTCWRNFDLDMDMKFKNYVSSNPLNTEVVRKYLNSFKKTDQHYFCKKFIKYIYMIGFQVKTFADTEFKLMTLDEFELNGFDDGYEELYYKARCDLIKEYFDFKYVESNCCDNYASGYDHNNVYTLFSHKDINKIKELENTIEKLKEDKEKDAKEYKKILTDNYDDKIKKIQEDISKLQFNN